MEWKYKDKPENKNYTKVAPEDRAYKNTNSWYKYWNWRPWMIKDNWKPLKKNGRKKWTKLKTEGEINMQMWIIVNLSTFWVAKIKHEKNVENWVQPNTPLTLPQACLEAGLPVASFYYYLNQYPAVKEKYEELKTNRREYLKELSENNIEKALSWKMTTITEKEQVDYSFKMLEKTDTNYNPKQIIEQTVEEINPDRWIADILADISDLTWK